MRNRRGFLGVLSKVLLAGVTGAVFLCRKAAEAADSWFRWPGYPNTESLRKHVATSSNHPEYGWSDVKGKSRSQLISMHDGSHRKSGDSAPLRKTTSSRRDTSSRKATSSRRDTSSKKRTWSRTKKTSKFGGRGRR